MTTRNARSLLKEGSHYEVPEIIDISGRRELLSSRLNYAGSLTSFLHNRQSISIQVIGNLTSGAVINNSLIKGINMAEYKKITCESWQHFKSHSIPELCGKGPFQRGVYLFRGHGSAQWSLMSVFDRKYMGMSRKKKVKMAEDLVNKFQEEAEGLDVDKALWSDKITRLALAQHSGVPTRLLDWTESPYIASFFAFAGIALNPNPEQYVAVWCLNTQSDVWSSDSGAEVLAVPTYGNDRLRSQLGKFTLLRAAVDSLEEYVQDFKEDDGALTQFLIPSSDAQIALADLDVMGINYTRLFAGLEGCALTATLRVRFNDLSEPKDASAPKSDGAAAG